MRYLDEFRDPALSASLAGKVRESAGTTPFHAMEVCGTHTVAIARSGLKGLLSGAVTFLSGPGCPVCVTPPGYVDAAVALAFETGVTVATFGDMVRVPGSRTSLEKARAEGADLRVVYSPLDAVALAEGEPGRQVVFLGVGFETTAPAVAGALHAARARGVPNFSVLPSLRTILPAMEAIASGEGRRTEGFLCPAHVSVILGADAYRPLAERHRMPCVVAGFEPLDILASLLLLLAQRKEGAWRVDNEYARAARPGGNEAARRLTAEFFTPCDAEWRGLSVLPGSGLSFRDDAGDLSAERRFRFRIPEGEERRGCRCGEVLSGKLPPSGCPLFGTACTPDEPYGPCMVSGEGACAAAYKYPNGYELPGPTMRGGPTS
jgi:hydrogenase expression/formation protein HypD